MVPKHKHMRSLYKRFFPLPSSNTEGNGGKDPIIGNVNYLLMRSVMHIGTAFAFLYTIHFSFKGLKQSTARVKQAVAMMMTGKEKEREREGEETGACVCV